MTINQHKEYLSKSALEVTDKINELWRKKFAEEIDIHTELEIEINDKGTFLPKDFCPASLLDFYFDGFEEYNEEKYEILYNFALWLEEFLGVHDGRKKY